MEVEDAAQFQCKFQFADFYCHSWAMSSLSGAGVGCNACHPSFSVPCCDGREGSFRSHVVLQRLMLSDSLGVCLLNVASGAHGRAGPCPSSIATMMAFVETQCPLMAARGPWSWRFAAIAGQLLVCSLCFFLRVEGHFSM